MNIDLSDIQLAQDRLECYKEMLNLTDYARDEMLPVSDLQDIISTASHITELMLKKLEEITRCVEAEIEKDCKEREEEQRINVKTKKAYDLILKMIDAYFSFDENTDFLKANTHGFTDDHTAGDFQLFKGVMMAFSTGRAFEKYSVGKESDIMDFLKRSRERVALFEPITIKSA